jgi:uncharacterized membrane protein
MRFAVALPWWGYAVAFGAAVALAWLAYRRAALALGAGQRAALTALRAATLVLLVAVLLRPVVVAPSTDTRNSLLTVLVDSSRSMRLSDDGGATRIEQAAAIAQDLQARLGSDYRFEVMTFGEALTRADAGQLAATARRSDLSGALAALADRSRGDQLAGVVVLSDGGDTSGLDATDLRVPRAPVFTVGIGSADAPRDREIVNLTAGEPLLANSAIDLSVSAVSHRLGTAPVDLRLLANGRPLEVRRVTPPADGAPIHEVFTVAPASDVATVYTVELPAAPGEIATENNTRSVMVPAQSGRRRLLMVEGAPGFEHTFLRRALALDSGLEVDSVVRKGQNDAGRDTFIVQAGARRAAALAAGYPLRKADLFAYDAIIFGNIEAEFFSREQLDMTQQFVAVRGGGLLVLGARSFERQGLAGTPLADVLPVDLTDRRGPQSDVSLTGTRGDTPSANAAALTADGLMHPATRLAVTVDESRKRWAALPPLASVALVGGPRPGAQVLAVTSSGGGPAQTLVAAQRYGQGRSLVFAGEASWRWRMMLPVSDSTYETLWRQMGRWLAAGAQGPVTIVPLSVTVAGTSETVTVVVKDEEFRPITNAEVSITLTAPDGQSRRMPAALTDPQEGRYAAAGRFDQSGVYKVEARATRAGRPIGATTRQVLSGGADLEMSDPRLNEDVLRRVALATGGRYLPAAGASAVPGLIKQAQAGLGPDEVRDLWQNGWVLAAIVGLLTAEWIVRRRVGFA